MEKSVEDVKDEASFLLEKNPNYFTFTPSSDNAPDTKTIMAQLDARLHAAQAAETNLESKISPSFLRYFLGEQYNLDTTRIVISCLIVVPLLLGFVMLMMSFVDKQEDKFDKFFNRMLVLTCWLFPLICSPILYVRYRRDIHRNHDNGIFNRDYESFKPLLKTEVNMINKGLDAIKYTDEKIDKYASGYHLRFFSNILANGITKINSTIEHNNRMRHSLFKACSKMPDDIKKLIFDYAVVEDLEKIEEKEQVRLQMS